MQFPQGLKGEERRTFHHTLASSHKIRVRLQVLDMDLDVLDTLTDEVTDGQTNIDADADITRSTTLAFLDRRHTYDFNSDSPSNGALYLNRIVRAHYDVLVPDLSDWVETAVHTGPVTKLDRSGDEVNVESQGMEALALRNAGRPMTVKKGVKKTVAIERILRERTPLKRFDLPDIDEKLPKAVSLGRMSQPWLVVQRIAESIGEGGRQLFCDGRGVVRLRKHPGRVFTFRDGHGGLIMSDPQVAFSTERVQNAVWVKGGKPKAKKSDEDGKKDKARGVEVFHTAPRSSPLSPWHLGRSDAPSFIVRQVDNDKIRSKKKAESVADKILERRLREVVEVTFDALPVPHLEEEDLIRVEPLGMNIRLGQASIPFKHDGLMSMGYLKRVSARRKGKNRR